MLSMRRLAIAIATIVLLDVVLWLPVATAQAVPGGHADTDGHLRQAEGTILKAEIVLRESELKPGESGGSGGQFRQAFRLADLVKSTGAVCNRASAGAGNSNEPRELFWFKGIKVEASSDTTQPVTGQFSLLVDPAFRNQVFPEGERCQEPMVMTLAPEDSELCFPAGLAVPAASDETWSIVFKTTTPTAALASRLPRVTVYFVRDSELVYPIQALRWKAPFSQPIADGDGLTDGKFARPQWRYENASTNAPFCGVPTQQHGESPAADRR